MLSAVGSDWLGMTVVSDWTVFCCLVISVVLVTHGDEEQVTEDFMELCSGVDSVLDDVEVISWVTVCFSDDRLTVSLEAESFAVELEAGGCEAHFCTAVSVAGARGGLTGSLDWLSTVADWLRLCCESGITAGSLTAVC